ncbi:MAG TPA: lysoplasmalogenase [Acidimicrobiales bacterium]|nr:lysoplasmalogenase [Acidimicrobiales bacterium]
MTALSWVLLVAAVLFAVGDWVARARSNAPLEYLCKPATLVALIGTTVALSPVHNAGARRAWFVAALVCSLAGDILLMLPTDRFVAGLAAFLVGHLCYVAGFWAHGPGGVAFAVAAAVVVVVVAPLGRRILGALGGQRELAVPVALYMVVISVMLATALATGNVLAGIGAALFVSSDTMIAWNRFVRPFAAADIGIMVTYHLGQAGLVLSLLH